MNKDKAIQKSIFDNALDEDFIKELDEIGKQSIEDFKVVQNELQKDVESGLITSVDVDKITSEFLLSLKNYASNKTEESVAFTFERNRIQLFDYIPSIMGNIPLIAKRFLETKLLLTNVSINRIHIGRISPDNVDGIEITSVFYITPYGSRLNVDLKEIYNVLLKIDFD
jgi:hypothetical protein